MNRKGLQGKILLKIGENTFAPTGAPSVKIVFDVKEKQVISLTILDPGPIVKAIKL